MVFVFFVGVYRGAVFAPRSKKGLDITPAKADIYRCRVFSLTGRKNISLTFSYFTRIRGRGIPESGFAYFSGLGRDQAEKRV